MRSLFRSSLLFLLTIASAFAQCDMGKPDSKTEAKPEAKPADAPLQMMTYQLVLFRDSANSANKAAKPTAKAGSDEHLTMMLGHLENMARLNNARINVLYGPFTGDDPGPASMQGLEGIALLDVPDAATAKQHFAADPFVKSGVMVLEVKPLLAPKGWFHEPTAPASGDPGKLVLEPLIFGVLVRGPAAKADPPVHTAEQRQAIQAGHLAYMGELNKQGKLVMAGPFMDMDAGEWRGVVVYRVGSVAEAQQLAANDPAVKAGRLMLEARPWMTLKGILK